MAEVLNIPDWIAGDTEPIIGTVTDINGAVVSLTAATIVYTLRKWNETGTIAFTKTAASGAITISGAGHNIFTITFATADTSLLTGQYHHVIEITLADGVTVFAGFIGFVTFIPSGA